MSQVKNDTDFVVRTQAYFDEKAKAANGAEKFVVALEMSKYLTAARAHGLSFEELRKLGFKFATV